MPGKTRLSKEERKARIIDAAKPLFAEKGFNGTSVRDIAKVAQVSEALLYRHFPSKEAMYREILSYPIRLSGAALRGIRDLEPGTRTLVLLVYALFQIILFESPGRERSRRYTSACSFTASWRTITTRGSFSRGCSTRSTGYCGTALPRRRKRGTSRACRSISRTVLVRPSPGHGPQPVPSLGHPLSSMPGPSRASRMTRSCSPSPASG